MIEISWERLRTNSESREISFESLNFQLAFKKYSKYGSFEYDYNTPGSEFYLTLDKDCSELQAKSGDTVGWQVKFWVNHNDPNNTSFAGKRRNELAEGLKTSLSYKKNLKTWIICTPGQPSNTIPNKTKDKLIKELKKVKPELKIIFWNKPLYEAFYHDNPEGFSSIFRHYFSEKFVGFSFIKEYSEKRIRLLKEKFDAELYTPGEVDKEIFSVINAKSLHNELSVSIKKLKKKVEEIEKDDRYNFSDFKCFKPGYIDQAKQLLGYRLSLAKEVINTFGKCKENAIAIIMELSYMILKLADEIHEITEELVKSLNDFSRNNNHIDEDNRLKYYRTWGREVKNMKYLVSSSNSITKALKKIDELSIKIITTNIHIFGKAGFGKTNLACAICDKMIKQGKPALLILASEIRNPGNVQKQILESLSLDSHMEFNDFLSALNNLGVLRNIKVPVVIDGLNETLPTAAVWSNELSYLIHDIEKFENLVLITTCRESYVEQVFNKKEYKDVANCYYLDGFSDGNIDVVIDRYFSKYDITIENTDFNRELLKNPLLLKIFCKTNQGKSIRVDHLNIFESLGNYKDELVRKASIKNKREDPICKNVLMNSISRFSAKIWQGNSRGINYPLEFTEIFDPCYDQSRINWEESNSYKVLDEGIFISRRMVGNSEYAEFTYDLLGGYCIAETVLFGNSPAD